MRAIVLEKFGGPANKIRMNTVVSVNVGFGNKVISPP
jgi:hypothetical protein